MLTNLYVKNMALIDEADIDFGSGLNILTGETGAGKSIILGSINTALGAKVSGDIIRQGCDYALVELGFVIEDEDKLKALREMEVEELDEGALTISRKLTASGSRFKVNGESFTAAQVRRIADILIDIHGQHDSQALLKEAGHMAMIDSFAGTELECELDSYKKSYADYRELVKKLKELNIDESTRLRELQLLEFEAKTIDEARLVIGEDEELEAQYRRLSNHRRIMEELSKADNCLNSSAENAMWLLGQAIKAVSNVVSYDDRLSEILDGLTVSEDTLREAALAISSYVSDSDYDEQSMYDIESRLDMINDFKNRYGRTIGDILEYREQIGDRLVKLANINETLDELRADIDLAVKKLRVKADEICALRRKAADRLCEGVRANLSELNFLNNEFGVDFVPDDAFPSENIESARFMISTNVGEPLKPLIKVASGGELSRIMLALKTVIADKDSTDTLIFDEIDAGISGITAQMVASKLGALSKNTQIICITHLPQIAACAKQHYVILKTVKDGVTSTVINRLSYDESVGELARLLGGANITELVLENAAEMKKLAEL